MFGLRFPLCLALLLAGCGDGDLPALGVSASALNSCNDATDCPQPPVTAICVKAVCTAHACGFAMNKTGACVAGCTADGQCALGTSYCYTPACTPTGDCDFTISGGTCTCSPSDVTNCPAPSSCQNATATCDFGVCTYTAKTQAGCCNSAMDCNTGASCNDTSNACACAAGRYCATGPSGCVTGTECCQDSDCGGGNTCSDGTCTCNGGQQHCPGIGCIAAGGCCGNADCTSPATCNGSHVCVCSGGMRYCAGIGCVGATDCCSNADCSGAATCNGGTHACQCPTAGDRYCAGVGCVPSTGCCVAGDCPAHANATVACTANACVYTCNSGFHDCSGTCSDDTSVASCGTRCSACPSGNACQAATCTSGTCGFGAAGASPCCGAVGDCVPENACQQAMACTANMCVFGSTGAPGCCNAPADCPAPTEPCLQAACVANQCATAPISGCTDDGGTPPADDLATAPPDLSAAISLSGGGGCSFAPAGDVASSAALALVALVLFAFAVRRRA